MTRAATTAATLKAEKAARAKESADRLKQAKRAASLLKMVSDGTRLNVIVILADGEQHVGALCEVLGQSQPAMSHHLALLRHGGLIAPRRDGKHNFYGLTEAGSELGKVVAAILP